jgi:hypothetical protein
MLQVKNNAPSNLVLIVRKGCTRPGSEGRSSALGSVLGTCHVQWQW